MKVGDRERVPERERILWNGKEDKKNLDFLSNRKY